MDPIRSIVADRTAKRVHIVDQTLLPFAVEERALSHWRDVDEAVRTMRVRGAPLIGVAAAYGVALAMSADATDDHLALALSTLRAARPTAVNLMGAIDRMQSALMPCDPAAREDLAWETAAAIEAADVQSCRRIGEHGAALLQEIHRGLLRPFNVLTHCHAGRMACVEWGTVTAALYVAKEAGMSLHVYVDETRPRNQGLITQWELSHADIATTYLTDNAGGLMIREGRVDCVLVGADRIARNGDTANKIGTYLKALAAQDNLVPFYVAAPFSTIDADLESGDAIPIEERGGEEVRKIRGRDPRGMLSDITLLAPDVPVANPAFDLTPARLITGFITDRGVFAPDELDAALGRP